MRRIKHRRQQPQLPRNHSHPCCEEGVPEEIQSGEDISLSTYKCPRGHVYEAPVPFIIATPDLAVTSGPVCVYCFANWFHVNLGVEELS